ncbi:MAG: FkbM family methyltransferase [Verrucomicrobiota bacterium]
MRIPFTRPSLSKIKLLVSNTAFRKNPLKVILRVAGWEFIQLFTKKALFLFDINHSVFLRANEGASRLTYYYGNSDPDTFAFMDSYLKPGMHVIDVGANIGLNAIYAARRVGRPGIVYAIEPDPSNFKRIVENIGQVPLPQLILIEAACGSNADQRVVIHHHPEDSSRSWVSGTSADLSPEAGNTVSTISIDSLTRNEKIKRVNYLKVDVEGFEWEVISGSIDCLRTHLIDVIQIELDENNLNRENSSAAKIVDLIESFGYIKCLWNATNGTFSPAPRTINAYNSFFVTPSLIS